jgi:HlyD family secretion protein
MKKLLKITVVLALLAGLGWAAYGPLARRWKASHLPRWRTAKVARGEIIATVNSNGTVKPVLEVMVGTFVSGPIIELRADFNQIVKKGELLARIDPRLYAASVARSEAALATREADVENAQALLQQAIRSERRALALQAENEDFISIKEMDTFHYNRKSLEARLKQTQAAVLQAEADLSNSEANLDYTEIRSPVDGMVIDRKIDEGQTLAAQFQTPELFVVAPDMKKKMHVFASVDEADIGLIQRAQQENRPVEFRVDAYPDDLFQGQIEQLRKNSTTTLNVVTYPVVVSAANPDLKLLPGMTASLSFQIAKKENILRIPNEALRFYPNRQQVRPEDRKIIDGTQDEENEIPEARRSAADRAAASRKRDHRHVWVAEGEWLKAVPVEIGLSDMWFSELVAGELTENQSLVTSKKKSE